MSSQMVLKLIFRVADHLSGFRSMSSQMVLKHIKMCKTMVGVLDLCHLKWY